MTGQIVPYQPREQLQGRPNVQQVAPNVGFGAEVGDGVQSLARGVDQYGAAVKDFAERQDTASVAELDTAFSDRVRQITTDYLATQGKNALSDRPAADKAWTDAMTEFSAAAKNPRQATMFNALARRRHDDWIGAASTHQNKEVETYLDASETARAAALGNDATVMPDGPERTARLEGQAAIIRQTGERKGLDAATVDAQILAARTVVHTNTIGAMIEAGGDPHEAESYLAKYADQIEPDKRTDLQEAVRTQVYKFDAMNAWDREGPPDPPIRHELPAGGGAPAQSFLLRPPVSAAMGSRYGPRTRPGPGASTNHGGVDYPVPVNTPVTASGPGVVRLRNQPEGMGQYVVVEHGNGLETLYGHVSAYQVTDGQRVEQGQVLALSGGARGANGAGNSTGPHLHYEVRRNGVRENPETDLGQTQQASAGSGQVDAAAMPRTAEDVRRTAARLAGEDWRKRDAYEREGLSRMSADRSDQAKSEADAWDAVQPYLPDGSRPVSDAASIPQSVWNLLSPQAQNSVRGQIRVANTREEAHDPVVADQTFNALMDRAANAGTTTQFQGLNLDEYASVMSRGQLNSLKATQRAMRNEAVPQNQTVEGRTTAALSGMTTLRNRYLANIGVETGDKATPEDARTTAQFNDAITRSVSTFIATNNRAPTDTEMTGMMSNLTRQVLPNGPARTGFLGLGAPETRRAFEGAPAQSFIPASDRAAIVAQFRRSGVERPTQSQIEAAYRLGLNRGTFQPPRGNQ